MKRELWEREEKETQLNNIKFEKNLIFKTNLNNSRRIFTILREDSLERNVGWRRTTFDKINQINLIIETNEE